MNNYPLFFKKKVIKYYKTTKNKISDIIDTFGISNGSLYNWVNKDKNNNLTEKQTYVKESKYTPYIKCYIRSYVIRKQVFNMELLLKILKRKFNLIAKKSSVYAIIKKFNITRKKVNTRYILGNKRNHNKKITLLKKQLKNTDTSDIISIDETSVDTHINNLYGWSIKGTRIKAIKNISRKRVSIICAINTKKIIHFKIIKGTVTSELFKEFLVELNLKGISNKILFMDNARIHHSKLVKTFMETSSNKIIYNVPYSPEFNPIELVFSKFKNTLRKKPNNHLYNKMINNIKLSFKKIYKNDLCNYYKHSFELLFK